MNFLSHIWTMLFGPKPVWQVKERTFLRREMDADEFGVDHFNVYAVKEVDLNSGRERWVEKWELDF